MFLFSFQAVLLNRNVPTPKNPTIPWFSKIPWLKIHDPARPCLSRLTSFLARQLSTVAYPWSGSQVQTPGNIGQSSRPESRHQSLHLCVWWGEHFHCLLDDKHRLTFQNDRGQYDTKNWTQDNYNQGNNFVDCPSLTPRNALLTQYKVSHNTKNSILCILTV